MFSVVIPLYNKARFVTQTLQSVLNQTLTNFEIIVVNDGSTDNSESVVNAIVDERIQLISIKNSGVSVARNTGIEKAKFPYVAFLDADDWWAPSYLEEMRQAISKYPYEKIFASGRSRVFKDTVERYANQYLPDIDTTAVVNYFELISVGLPPVNSSNSIFNKTLFKEIGTFKVGVSQHEDHDLWIRLAATHNIVFINKALSFYRKTEENTASSSHYQAAHFLSYIESMQKVLPQLSNKERTNFLTYTNTFIFFTFLQNCSHYSKLERKTILDTAKGLVGTKSAQLLKIASYLSFLHLYKIYKHIKG